jgi:hypothetical protein
MNTRFRQIVVAAVALVVVGSLTITEASAQWRWRRRCCCCDSGSYGYSGAYSGGYGVSYAQPMAGYTTTGYASGGCNSGAPTTQVYGNTHSVTGAESRTIEAPGVQPQPAPPINTTNPDNNRLEQNPNNSIPPRNPDNRNINPPAPTDTTSQR